MDVPEEIFIEDFEEKSSKKLASKSSSVESKNLRQIRDEKEDKIKEL